MRKILLLPIALLFLATLSIGFSAAGTGDATGEGQACLAGSQPCCLQKPETLVNTEGQGLQSKCCSQDKAEKDVPANPNRCNEEECSTAPGSASKCGLCVKALSSDISTTSGKNKLELAATASPPKCESCSDETCKQECERCAEARKITAVNNDTSNEVLNGSSDAKSVAAQSNDSHGGVGMMGRGHGGPGHGPGMMGRGPNAMSEMREDMGTLHAMFADRDKIRRKVTNLPNGAEAITESDDESIADLLREHVPAMEDRVVGNAPLPPMTFHPIFIELIKHADDYTLTYENTDSGIKVKYISDSPYVIMLVQEHAKLVSRFIKNGMQEVHNPYTLPELSSQSTK